MAPGGRRLQKGRRVEGHAHGSARQLLVGWILVADAECGRSRGGWLALRTRDLSAIASAVGTAIGRTK